MLAVAIAAMASLSTYISLVPREEAELNEEETGLHYEVDKERKGLEWKQWMEWMIEMGIDDGDGMVGMEAMEGPPKKERKSAS